MESILLKEVRRDLKRPLIDETEVSINEILVNEGHAKVYLP